MIEEYVEYFKKYNKKFETHTEVDGQVKEKYEGKFLLPMDDFDLLTYLWENDGFASYRNGLFSFVNPDEYSELAKKFPGVGETALVFAKTNAGCLFFLEKLAVGDSILYLNVHTGKVDLVSSSFQVFIAFNLSADSFWNRECYGKIELTLAEKHEAPAFDECYAFMPALSLGGNESISKMKKVKIKPHLEMLSQLLS